MTATRSTRMSRPPWPAHAGTRGFDSLRLGLLGLLAGIGWAISAPAAGQTETRLAGPGLATRDASSTWLLPRLRLLPTLQEGPAFDGSSAATRAAGGGLLGAGLVADLFLSPSGLGPRVEGGFRATSGLLQAAGPGGMGLSLHRGEASGPLPYLGVGYSGLLIGSGLSVQADLGLVAASGTVRLGRSLQTGPAADELVRELRLAPVVRLGISYAF